MYTDIYIYTFLYKVMPLIRVNKYKIVFSRLLTN